MIIVESSNVLISNSRSFKIPGFCSWKNPGFGFGKTRVGNISDVQPSFLSLGANPTSRFCVAFFWKLSYTPSL